MVMTNIGIIYKRSTRGWNILFELIPHRGVRLTSNLGNYATIPPSELATYCNKILLTNAGAPSVAALEKRSSPFDKYATTSPEGPRLPVMRAFS